MEHTQLTMDDVTRFYQSEASLNTLARSNASLKTKLDQEPGSIDRLTAAVQSQPAYASTVSAHGFTPYQFAVVEFTIIQTILALAAKQAGADPATLAHAHVAPANIQLFEQHHDEITALHNQLKP